MKIKNQGKKAVSIAMSVLMAASLYPVTVVGGDFTAPQTDTGVYFFTDQPVENAKDADMNGLNRVDEAETQNFDEIAAAMADTNEKTKVKVSYVKHMVSSSSSPEWKVGFTPLDTSTGIHFLKRGSCKDSEINGDYTVQWFQVNADDSETILDSAPTDAGTYKIKVTLGETASALFELENDTLDYTIKPMTLNENTILALYQKKDENGNTLWLRYTGEEQLPDKNRYQVANSSYILPEDCYEFEKVDGEDYINYGYGKKIKIVGKGNVTGSKTATFSIERAKPSLPENTKKQYEYNGTPKDTTGEMAPDNYKKSASEWCQEDGRNLSDAPKDVGNYKVRVSYIPDVAADKKNNYSTEYRWEEYEITPKKLNAKVNVTKAKTYDTSTQAQVTCTPIGIVTGDDVTLTARAEYDDKNAGKNKKITVTFSLSGKDAKNYTAPDDQTFEDGEITQKTLTVEPEYPSSRWWDSTKNVALTKQGWTTIGGYSSVDNYQLDLSDATAEAESSDAGNQNVIFKNVRLSGSGSANYKLELEPRTISIQKLNLGSSSVRVSFTYDQGRTVYTGNAVYPQNATVMVRPDGQDEFTLDNSLWEFIPDSDSNYISAGDAGAYISAKSDNTNVCEKHFINYTIQKASSSIATLPAANSGLIYSGVAQPLVTAGNADGGTIQYKLDGGEWTNKVPTAVKAGTYKVFYRIQGDKNHTDSDVQELTVTIGKKEIKVIAKPVTKHVNKPDPDLTYEVQGMEKEDTLSGVKVSVVDKAEVPGKYQINVTGEQETENYKITYVPSIFTINDHDWSSEWKVTTQPTAWSVGKREKTCAYDGCGQKKYETIPATGEEEDPNKGKLEKGAEIQFGAPIQEVTLNNTETELLNDARIFTDTERTEITSNGTKAKIWIEISGKNESDLTQEEKDAIETELQKISGKTAKAVYFNAELFKQVGTEQREQLHETDRKLKVSVRIPDELLNNQSNMSRVYKIVRMHNNSAEVINGNFNGTTKQFTFETDRFSTYVLTYSDTYYEPDYPATGVTVTPDKATLTKEGETVQLTATVIPSYADNKTVTWTPSDEKVAIVDKDGKVTAAGNGTATITARTISGNHTASVTVTVNIPEKVVEIEKITVSTDKKTLTKIGETTQLVVQIEPEDAQKQELTWTSSDERIAAVDKNGKVTAVGTGKAVITVTTKDRKHTATVEIIVKIADEPTVNLTTGFGKLKLRSTKQSINSITLTWNRVKGADGYMIYGNLCNSNGKVYKYQKLRTVTNGETRSWTHTELKKGTYYKYVVKAYKLINGKRVVTDSSVSVHAVTKGGKYGVAKGVSVTKIGNRKNTLNISLSQGKSTQITAKEVRQDKPIRHHRNLCYASSNAKVATVTPSGKVTATGKGTCKIWVYAQNGVYKTITVSVK